MGRPRERERSLFFYFRDRTTRPASASTKARLVDPRPRPTDSAGARRPGAQPQERQGIAVLFLAKNNTMIFEGVLLKELMIRGDLERCLIISPGSLTERWQNELGDKFGLVPNRLGITNPVQPVEAVIGDL